MSRKAPAQSQFLLLIRDPADGQPEPTDEQFEKLFAWLRDLKKRGHLVAVHPLDKSAAKTLRGARSLEVIDGPFAEAKEVVGGYVLVTAKNLAQAVELAKGFPMFSGNRSVEVRPLHSLDHELG